MAGFSIRLKIIVPLAIMFLLALGQLAYFVYSFATLKNELEKGIGNTIPIEQLTSQLNYQEEKLKTHVFSFALSPSAEKEGAIFTARVKVQSLLNDYSKLFTYTSHSGLTQLNAYLKQREVLSLATLSLLSTIKQGNSEQQKHALTRWLQKEEVTAALRGDLIGYAINLSQSSLEALSEAQHQQPNVFLGFICVNLLLIALTFLVSKKYITRPLHNLTHAANKLASGDFDIQINTRRNDEMGTLSRTFVAMADNINQFNQRLEGKVRERTRELEQEVEQRQQAQEALKEQSEKVMAANQALMQNQAKLQSQSRHLKSSKQALEQKAEELKQASKYKSEFLANMSHELRTPLNSLLILSRSFALNKAGNLTPQQVNEANIIYEGGVSLLDLINDILDMSKVEAGMLDICPHSFTPAKVSKNLASLFTPVAMEKSLSFSIDVEVTHALFNDGHRVEQIVKNFLSNAFKFTQSGMIHLRVHLPAPRVQLRRSDLNHDKCVAFSVTDTGVGIEASKLALIFAPFSQADGSTSRHYGGTGLGLSISKELAQLLGGELQVTSTPGCGSTFTLYLPTSSQEHDEKAVPEVQILPEVTSQSLSSLPVPTSETSISEPDQVESELKGKTLLLVDANMRSLFTMTMALENAGLKVTQADTAESALDLYTQQTTPFSFVLMDADTALANGEQTLSAMQQESTNTSPAMFSLLCDAEKAPQALPKTGARLISKPFDINKVLASLGQ